ncbi:MAG: lysine--tRNA ligase, partial [Eubacteriales bacterium]
MEHPVDQLNQEQELTQEQLSELLQVRRDKLSALQAAGQDPFANTTYDVSHYSSDILAMPQPPEGEHGAQVSIAGRMISRRIMGKASFGHPLDARGRIQVYFKRDELPEGVYDA